MAQAWAVLSDSIKKPLYDNELNLFSKIDLTTTSTSASVSAAAAASAASAAAAAAAANTTTNTSSSQQNKLPVRRTNTPARNDGNQGTARLRSFWTVCPYCYVLYEYPRIYEDCCLKCQKCQKAFHAASLPTMPPMVPGQEAYYCCWAFFPLGFVLGNSENGGGGEKSSGPVPAVPGFPNWMPPMFQTAANESGKRGKAPAGVPKKRGRPRLS